jgi:hypothetical protein
MFAKYHAFISRTKDSARSNYSTLPELKYTSHANLSSPMFTVATIGSNYIMSCWLFPVGAIIRRMIQEAAIIFSH